MNETKDKDPSPEQIRKLACDGLAAILNPDTGEPIVQALWRQVRDGVDQDRLLPGAEKRLNALTKKLDKPLYRNGWRIFVAGQVHAMLNGKAPKRRSAEVMLIESVSRWHRDVFELLPGRLGDLEAIVRAGIANPQPSTQNRGDV